MTVEKARHPDPYLSAMQTTQNGMTKFFASRFASCASVRSTMNFTLNTAMKKKQLTPFDWMAYTTEEKIKRGEIKPDTYQSEYNRRRREARAKIVSKKAVARG